MVMAVIDMLCLRSCLERNGLAVVGAKPTRFHQLIQVPNNLLVQNPAMDSSSLPQIVLKDCYTTVDKDIHSGYVASRLASQQNDRTR